VQINFIQLQNMKTMEIKNKEYVSNLILYQNLTYFASHKWNKRIAKNHWHLTFTWSSHHYFRVKHLLVLPSWQFREPVQCLVIKWFYFCVVSMETN